MISNIVTRLVQHADAVMFPGCDTWGVVSVLPHNLGGAGNYPMPGDTATVEGLPVFTSLRGVTMSSRSWLLLVAYPSESVVSYDLVSQRVRSLVSVDFIDPDLFIRKNGQRADLRQVNIQDFDLSFVNLTEADLSQCNARGVRAHHSQMMSAKMIGSDWYGADLTGADLRDVDLRSVGLDDAVLRGAQMSGTNLNTMNHRRVDMRDVRVVSQDPRSDWRGSGWQGCDFTGADLRGADLEGARLYDCTYGPTTRWPFDFDPEEASA